MWNILFEMCNMQFVNFLKCIKYVFEINLHL